MFGKALVFMGALTAALVVVWFVSDELALYPDTKEIESCISAASQKHNVSPALIRAIIWRESKFNPRVVGKAKEIGLMQITDGAVKDWSAATKQRVSSRRSLFKPSLNIEIGTWYLARAAKHWNGYKSKEILQISEYNAGYGNVSKGWKPKSPDREVKLSDITISSTRKYVEDVLKKKAEYEKSEKK
ncbi:MAG: transglycosylase SLT domain-containing protein [Victivallales bacterium]|nr:transglycosylase SLT domain-containing protein [Victivallales bacterium]